MVKESLFLKKQNELFNIKKNEIKKLEEELKTLQKLYQNKINQKYEEQQKIADLKYVNIKDSTEAIAYLVSLVKSKNYIVKEFKTKIYTQDIFSRSKVKPVLEDYTIVYIVDKNKEKQALKELKERFEMHDDIEEKYLDRNDYLKIPSDHYIELAYYKDHDPKQIYYDRIIHVNDRYSFASESKICDEKYAYILDYMDSVLNYKINNKNYEITLDEMKGLAHTFCKEHFKSKVKMKRS